MDDLNDWNDEREIDVNPNDESCKNFLLSNISKLLSLDENAEVAEVSALWLRVGVFSKVQNVEVSDTTDDAMKNYRWYQNLPSL
jgi:hypothetical protein